ncbi:Protein kinase C [Hondaea fermentalgiana]|uniref:Protein kinase C n=1 Tax=Hondaea fermentalgiana TaxID=2315210 RepID=A0A2R5H0B0_9STRA|nr:Protein kinase C [Hondaea fermentalgiana]|eukprot:GBG34181.1 Protein kinase C [Hondaea fermentalgiana]
MLPASLKRSVTARQAAPTKVAHDFEKQRFSTMTRCFVCDEMIEHDVLRGIMDYTTSIRYVLGASSLADYVPKGDGCTCRVCGVNVHESCASQIQSSCVRVTHNFELRSWPPLTKHCYACGLSLQGLFNQGYQCTECGVICHALCRTNVNIRYCEAAPDVDIFDGDPNRDTRIEGEGDLYEYVGDDPDRVAEIDAERSSSARSGASAAQRNSWRSSVRRAAAAVTGGAARGSGRHQARHEDGEHAPAAGAAPIQIPSSLKDMGKELRKLHTQSQGISMAEAERWNREQVPRLRVLKKELTSHKKKLKAARDKVSAKVDKRGRARAIHYRTFAKKLISKHMKKKMKKGAIDDTVNELLELYSMHRCRETELLDELAQMLPPEAGPAIEKEREEGPCRPNGKLERSLEDLDKLRKQVQVATQSLEAVRRELYFPRWRHWFLRVGLEGTYAALGALWLEQFQGSIAIRFAMLPTSEKKDAKLVPTVVIALGGYDTEYDFDEMGTSNRAARHRQKESEAGMSLVARVEQLSVSGSSLPMSITLDQLSLDLEFYLNIEMEYVTSRKKNILGSWQLKPNAFSLKFKRFGLNFKGGSVSVPDALLRTVVKNLLVSAAKQSVKAALPPEFGEYMHFMHKHTPTNMRADADGANNGKHAGQTSNDQLRYHGRIDVNAEIDLESLDHVMESSEVKPPPKPRGIMSGAMRGATRAVMAAAGVTSGPARHAYKDEPVQTRVERALGLDAHQIDLFIRAQQELGLTHNALFPEDSLTELGLKAIYSVRDDPSVTAEAANRIGLRYLNGDLLSTEVPLKTIIDIVQYVLTYFGPTARKNPHTPRILALWQGALDKTLRKMLQSNSFRAHHDDEPAGSTRSIRSRSTNDDSDRRVRRIIIADFIDRVLKLARRRIITRIEMLHWDAALGVSSMQKVARDKMLQAAANSRGGNAMVFQMKSSGRDEVNVDADDGLDGDDEDDDRNTGANTNSMHLDSLRGMLRSAGVTSHGLADDEDDDDDDEDLGVEDLLEGVEDPQRNASSIEELPFGEKQRIKEAQIHARFDQQAQYLDFVRQKLLREMVFTVAASAGQGKFNLEITDGELVAPVDFAVLLGGTVFSNRSRVNNWPWRRMVRVEKDGHVHLAIVQILDRGDGPGTETYTDPDDEDGIHLLHSGLRTHLQSVGHPLRDIMHLSILPEKPCTSWSDAGQVSFSWNGDRDLRFSAHMDRFRAHGGLPTLHKFSSDILDWSLRAVTDPRLEEISRFALSVLIRYATLNTFDGGIWTNFQMESTEDDLFLRASIPDRARSAVSLDLQHDFMDFTDDISHFIEFYRTDPVDLGNLTRTVS